MVAVGREVERVREPGEQAALLCENEHWKQAEEQEPELCEEPGEQAEEAYLCEEPGERAEQA